MPIANYLSFVPRTRLTYDSLAIIADEIQEDGNDDLAELIRSDIRLNVEGMDDLKLLQDNERLRKKFPQPNMLHVHNLTLGHFVGQWPTVVAGRSIDLAANIRYIKTFPIRQIDFLDSNNYTAKVLNAFDVQDVSIRYMFLQETRMREILSLITFLGVCQSFTVDTGPWPTGFQTFHNLLLAKLPVRKGCRISIRRNNIVELTRVKA